MENMAQNMEIYHQDALGELRLGNNYHNKFNDCKLLGYYIRFMHRKISTLYETK